MNRPKLDHRSHSCDILSFLATFEAETQEKTDALLEIFNKETKLVDKFSQNFP